MDKLTSPAHVMARLMSIVDDGAEVGRSWAIVHDGAPVSKSRARWSRKSGRFYTPGATVAAEDQLAQRFRDAMGGETIQGSVAIVATFFRPNYQRIDADNLMKLVMDSATKAGVWVDDCYVVAQASFMEFDRDWPRTAIAWCETSTSFDRRHGFICTVCGGKFFRKSAATFSATPATCSAACRGILHKIDRGEAKCPKCDVVFKRNSAGQRYCSVTCSNSLPRVRVPNANARPPSTCQKCGTRVSRREYTFCANCRQKGRPLGSKNKPKAGEQAGTTTVTFEATDVDWTAIGGAFSER